MKENNIKKRVLSTNICSFPQSQKVIHIFLLFFLCINPFTVHKKAPLRTTARGLSLFDFLNHRAENSNQRVMHVQLSEEKRF